MRSDKMLEPAFPVHPDAHSRSDAECAALQGMALRDWFAGQALAGWVNQGSIVPTDDEPCRNVAKWCYAMADAMIAAREGK